MVSIEEKVEALDEPARMKLHERNMVIVSSGEGAAALTNQHAPGDVNNRFQLNISSIHTAGMV